MPPRNLINLFHRVGWMNLERSVAGCGATNATIRIESLRVRIPIFDSSSRCLEILAHSQLFAAVMVLQSHTMKAKEKRLYLRMRCRMRELHSLRHKAACRLGIQEIQNFSRSPRQLRKWQRI